MNFSAAFLPVPPPHTPKAGDCKATFAKCLLCSPHVALYSYSPTLYPLPRGSVSLRGGAVFETFGKRHEPYMKRNAQSPWSLIFKGELHLTEATGLLLFRNPKIHAQHEFPSHTCVGWHLFSFRQSTPGVIKLWRVFSQIISQMF